MPAWLIQVFIAIVVSAIGYALSPKPKAQGPKAQTLESPTIDAGRNMPVVFGRVRVKSPNLMYMGGRFTEEVKRRV